MKSDTIFRLASLILKLTSSRKDEEFGDFMQKRNDLLKAHKAMLAQGNSEIRMIKNISFQITKDQPRIIIGSKLGRHFFPFSRLRYLKNDWQKYYIKDLIEALSIDPVKLQKQKNDLALKKHLGFISSIFLITAFICVAYLVFQIFNIDSSLIAKVVYCLLIAVASLVTGAFIWFASKQLFFTSSILNTYEIIFDLLSLDTMWKSSNKSVHSTSLSRRE